MDMERNHRGTMPSHLSVYRISVSGSTDNILVIMMRDLRMTERGFSDRQFTAYNTNALTSDRRWRWPNA